jgi:hypothetical protein
LLRRKQVVLRRDGQEGGQPNGPGLTPLRTVREFLALGGFGRPGFFMRSSAASEPKVLVAKFDVRTTIGELGAGQTDLRRRRRATNAILEHKSVLTRTLD